MQQLAVFILFIILQCCHSGQGIVLGKRSASEKPYVVYLLRSEKSNKLFVGWLCGGTIVSPRHILTAAACLEDVSNLYAIAGYRKYLPSKMLDSDECTRARKKRVVKTCTPNRYILERQNPPVWMQRDIGFAIVETPYDFNDKSYRIDCDYTPQPIRVNLASDMIRKGLDAVVFGWGHTARLRMPGDDGDYNTEYMYEGSTVITDKGACKKRYTGLDMVIDKYLICCDGVGQLNGDGENKEMKYASRENSCPPLFRRHSASLECGIIYDRRRADTNYNDTQPFTFNSTVKLEHYKEIQNDNASSISKANAKIKTKYKISRNSLIVNGRRYKSPGICQNDHGSPLVAWEGSEEVVIGVATSALINSMYMCIPPYLYTSTSCNSQFIACALSRFSPDYHNPMRRFCDEMHKAGYALKETIVPWDPPDDGSSRTNPPESNDFESQLKESSSLLSSTMPDSNYKITMSDNITRQYNIHKILSKLHKTESSKAASNSALKFTKETLTPSQRKDITKRRKPTKSFKLKSTKLLSALSPMTSPHHSSSLFKPFISLATKISDHRSLSKTTSLSSANPSLYPAHSLNT